MKRWIAPIASLVLMMVTVSAVADGFIVIREPLPGPRRPISPGPMPPPRSYEFAPLEVSYHHVKVKIDGQIATTSVDEEFYNPNPQRLEGTYLFPIPKGAQIDKFAMDIGGREVQAELLAADKARQIYEDIVRKMRDPALMEYADRDVFKVRIFPIEPNNGKHVTLSYTQVLKSDSGLVSYTYPLNTEKFSAKPIKDVSVQVELQTERPLKTIYSPTHSVEIKRHGSASASVGYEASGVLPDTDFTLYFAPEKDEIGVNLLTHKTDTDDGSFLLLVSPGLDSEAKNVMPKDIAFVLDTSGSMAGAKLEQAKRALRFCVENLNDQDRFEVIRFSTEVEPLFGELVTAEESNRKKANDFIKNLHAMGATAIDDALQKALALHAASNGRPFVVIFITDGMPTIGVTDENQILADVKKAGGESTRVFCFGIGGDVNTHLLDKITEQTRAVSQYVLPEEDIEVKVSNFLTKIKDPVLANPSIKFTGGVHASKMYPSPLPDLFRGDQLVLSGRYSGEGSSAVILEGTVNGEKKQFTYEVKFPAREEQHEFIARLWATRRVGYLLDEIRLHGENAELRDETTALARQFNIVTPYTAYLIMEDEGRRNVPLAMQSLPQLSSDRKARIEAKNNWDGFKNETGGEKALAGSRYSSVLKSADAPAAASIAGEVEANRALGFAGSGSSGMPATADSSKARLVNDSRQGQLIAGKNFFQNTNNEWVDSLAQQFQNAKHQRIQFDSVEYFDFAAKHPKALSWLALGTNVRFVLDDTLYEIYE
jgi:Ca-activated chloride channel family protein